MAGIKNFINFEILEGFVLSWFFLVEVLLSVCLCWHDGILFDIWDCVFLPASVCFTQVFLVGSLLLC